MLESKTFKHVSKCSLSVFFLLEYGEEFMFCFVFNFEHQNNLEN